MVYINYVLPSDYGNDIVEADSLLLFSVATLYVKHREKTSCYRVCVRVCVC